MRNLWILEAATDWRSVKVGILKSVISLLEKYLRKSFFSIATKNFTENELLHKYFQGSQTTCLTWLLYKTAIFKNTSFLRGSAQPAFICPNSIELTSIVYKVNNKDTRTMSVDVFLLSFMLTLNRFYTLY